jgi:hypothetical protein
LAIEGRRLVAVYSRDGDLFQLDLKAGTETKLGRASTSADEEQPSIVYGRIAFTRRGSRGGTFLLDKGKVRRISRARPSLLAFNGSRIAYPTSKGVRLHRVSGRGRDSFARQGREGGVALNLTRYSVTFMRRGGEVFQTTRFGGSSNTDVIRGVRRGKRTLPASTSSFVNQGGFLRYYLDDEGVHRITRDEDIFRR